MVYSLIFLFTIIDFLYYSKLYTILVINNKNNLLLLYSQLTKTSFTFIYFYGVTL